MVGLEELCSRGHDLNRLITEYPISLVKGLIEASQWNTKVEMLISAQGISAGVSNALDGAFSKGKGKVLQKFQKNIFKKINRSKNVEDAAKKMLGAFGIPSKGK